MFTEPQPPVPELLSELFSEQLGYPITPTDLGLQATDEHEVGLRYSESITATVVAVAELERYDVRRRGFLRDGAFLAVAAIAPSRDWLLAVLDATERRPVGRIGLAQVRIIQETFSAFQEADTLWGGGHARRALAEYLTGRVLPLLHDADPHSEVGAAQFAAASEQTDLLGWMAIDDDQPALGRRYLIQALRLAQESGDIAFGDLDAANKAVNLSITVQSSRCVAAVRDLQSRISPYRAIASARDFDERAHEVLTKASLN